MYILAPMAELSHRALRELIEGFFNEGESRGTFGPAPPRPAVSPAPRGKNVQATPLCGDTPQRPEYYTEMISAAGLLSGGPFEKWYLDGGPCPERLVYQLLGADPGKLAPAAALLDRRDCLGIDINMGCAAPAITRTGAGVKLMEDIDKAGRIVAAIRKVTTKRLSIKLRLGTRCLAPVFGRLLAFCRRLESEGADRIALHPRFADEKFKRRARWDYVDALRAGLSIPVAGNGDISSAGELVLRARDGPVMAGRLAVKEPWVFALAGTVCPPAGPLEETAHKFLDLLSRHQPPEFHLSRARRFFRYYCDNFTWAEYLRNKINRARTLSGIGRIISEYCRENPQPGQNP
ncbi:MAG: tRNA-dihydrouridine synthase family protein [Treponema sp.]|nr:tRNA-dihydrouridine synthase family protein [Treponema sp.]